MGTDQESTRSAATCVHQQARKYHGAWAMLVVVVGLCAGVFGTSRGRTWIASIFTRMMGRATVEQRLAEVGPASRSKWQGAFDTIKVPYPPSRVALLIMKQERVMEVHVAADMKTPAWRFLIAYPILGTSGTSGPKLAEGDMQVPEGLYAIESLNPNSRYHLALRVNYPNDDDRNRARADGRSRLGGDIMIHGGSASIGCLAMGDLAIEELFVLAADVGIENMTVIIAPCDLRQKDRSGLPIEPKWIPLLYDEIEAALRPFALTID